MNPNPLAWAIFTDEGLIRIWSTAGTDVAAVAEATGKTPTPLYAAPVALSADRDRILAAAAFFFRMATGDEESECGEWDRHETTIDAARSGVTTAPPAQDEHVRADDLVSVPRGLLGSACYAMANRMAAPNTLAKLRGYAFSRTRSVQPSCNCTGLCEQRGLASDEVDATCHAVFGKHQPTPQPEQSGLVEALRTEALNLCNAVENINDLPPVKYALQAGLAVNKVRDAAAALAASQTGSPEGLSRQAAGGEA